MKATVISKNDDGDHHTFPGVFADEDHAANVHGEMVERRAAEMDADPEDVENDFHLHEPMDIAGKASKGDVLHIVHSPSAHDEHNIPAIHGVFSSLSEAKKAAESVSKSIWSRHGPEFDPAGPEDFHPKTWKEYSANWKQNNPTKPSLDKLWDKIPNVENFHKTPEAQNYFDSVMSAARKKPGDRADYRGLADTNRYFEDQGEPSGKVLIGRSRMMTPKADNQAETP
jgi:hypothetical protein